MKKIIGIDFDGTCVTDLFYRNLLFFFKITNMEKEEKKFATEYQINGKKYAGEIWATSWEEAESFIKQRSSTEKVVGFIPSLEPVIEERPYMSIEFCKKEFFLLDEELESFKEFLNDPTRNIYHSIDGIKIVKSEDGKLCGVGRMPRHLRT